MHINALLCSGDLSIWEGGRGLRQECGIWRALAGWHDRISDWHGNFSHRVISEMSLPHDNAIVGPVVEAANESIVAKRFKGSRIRWSMESGQAIKTIRALAMSGRFDRAWTALEANDSAKPTREALVTWDRNAAAVVNLHPNFAGAIQWGKRRQFRIRADRLPWVCRELAERKFPGPARAIMT